MKILCRSAVFLLLALQIALYAQADPVDLLPRLAGNRGKLQVTVEVDRQSYFPGESAVLTITIRNPTSGTLDIYQPFTAKTGTVALLQKNGPMSELYRQEYAPLGSGPYEIRIPLSEEEARIPTAQIKPGEQLVKRLRFRDHELGSSDAASVIAFGAAPPYSGEFRVS